MNISFPPYKSITPFDWIDVPRFAILTGENGAGKSQMLNMIAAAFKCYVPDPVDNPGSPGPRAATVSDDSEQPTTALHLRSDWRNTHSIFYGQGSEQRVRQLISNLHATKDAIPISRLPAVMHPSGGANGLTTATDVAAFWRALSEDSGLNIQACKALEIAEFEEVFTLRALLVAVTDIKLSEAIVADVLIRRRARDRGLNNHEIQRKFGHSLIQEFDTLLQHAGLPYKSRQPEPRVEETIAAPAHVPDYSLEFEDLVSGARVAPAELSSGERVILTLVGYILMSTYGRPQPSLLILDEPDAHLHPSMVATLRDVLQRIIIDSGGRVIMSTHSPTTVATANSDSVFWVSRSEPRLTSIDPMNATARLVKGFVAVTDASQLVILEGKTDKPFYEAIWETLTSPMPNSSSVLSPFPGLAFVEGPGGNSPLKSLIGSFRDAGFPRFHGIIDGDHEAEDSETDIPEYLHKLSRYSIENYFCDPIVLWLSALLDHRRDAEIPGIARPNPAVYGRIGTFPQDVLQTVADAMLTRIAVVLGARAASDDAVVVVKFQSGLELNYPRWLLYTRGHDLLAAVRQVSAYQYPVKVLCTAFQMLQLVPVDLADVFKAIQDSAWDQASSTAGNYRRATSR